MRFVMSHLYISVDLNTLVLVDILVDVRES